MCSGSNLKWVGIAYFPKKIFRIFPKKKFVHQTKLLDNKVCGISGSAAVVAVLLAARRRHLTVAAG
jgi:hypothetical protein